MRFVFDIETNGLPRKGLDHIHCLAIHDLNTDEQFVFNDQGKGKHSITTGLNILMEAKELVGHNIIGFDIPVIQGLYPWFRPEAELFDTLIMSRLVVPHIQKLDFMRRTQDMPVRLYGRHSLEAWGWRLGVHKGDFKDHTDWLEWSQEMEDYCVRDVKVTSILQFKFRSARDAYPEAVKMEHDCAVIMADQEVSGWPFDVDAAHKLESVLRSESEVLRKELMNTFPYVASKVMTPLRDNKTKGYIKGATFTKLVDFNPTSRDHVAWCFENLRGWHPDERTETGRAKIDETVLLGMGDPTATKLAKLLELQKGLGQLSEGANSWLKAVTKEGRIHHSCSLATNTGRNAHRSPNLGQVSSDPRCRKLFTAGRGRVVVGADASGLELRMLGHYLSYYDGGRFADIVVNGDIHQINADAVGVSRKAVKSLTYAFLYGAGDEKLGRTMDSSLKGQKARTLGKSTRAKFVQAIPGLEPLLQAMKGRAATDQLIGLDGRPIFLQGKAHAALNYLLQSAGAIVCKNWVVRSYHELEGRGLYTPEHLPTSPVQPLGFIHDEIQMSCVPEAEDATKLILMSAIIEVGTNLNLRVPLAAEAKHGLTWADTH
jgi:DNA polymerase I-like protein with 3'-5' exonuclease and polymerase domains